MSYFEIVPSDSDELHFILNKNQHPNIDRSLTNGIRRTILNDYPTYGIKSEPITESDVRILTNTTSLHNEIMSHRIGMIPININVIDYFRVDNIQFEIDVKNVTTSMISITSEDINIRILDKDELIDKSIRDKVFPPDTISGDYILICKLKPNINEPQKGESFKCICKCSLNTGLTNARYSPVCKIIFYNERDPEKVENYINTQIDNKKKEEGRDLTEDEVKEIVRKTEIFEGDRCFYTDSINEANVFRGEIETIGTYSNQEIIDNSITYLKKSLSKVVNALKDNNTNEVEMILPESINTNLVDVLIKFDTHTLGNLIQSYMYRLHLKDKIKSVGYKVPHPLKNECVVRVEPNLTEKDDKFKIVEEIIYDTIDYIQNLLDKLQVEWKTLFSIPIPQPIVNDTQVEAIKKPPKFKIKKSKVKTSQ